jgi:hypothetical protein
MPQLLQTVRADGTRKWEKQLLSRGAAADVSSSETMACVSLQILTLPRDFTARIVLFSFQRLEGCGSGSHTDLIRLLA